MNFRPIDEMSLRHLFSTQLANEMLNLSYVGPVLDQLGKVDTSPDALILDMRKSPYRILRCEFKFIPNSKEDFSHNGKFDIAVIWAYGNGCYEIIALDESKAFHALPDYSKDAIALAQDFRGLKSVILKRDVASVIVLYMAASVYPERIDSEKVFDYLAKRFPHIKSMPGKAKGNIVGAFIQTNPPLLEWVFSKNYQWIQNYDSLIAKTYLAELIQVNFREDLPTDEDLKLIVAE